MEKLHPKITHCLILSILFLLPVYLIKIKIGWISSNALELLIGLLLIVQIFNSKIKYKILSNEYVAGIFLILLGLLLSTVAHRNYYVGLGAIKGWFIFPIVFGIVFYDALKKDGQLLKKSLLMLFYSGVAVSVIGMMYKISGSTTFDNRLKIFWDSPNHLAMFLAVPFLIGSQFIFQHQNRRNLFLLGSVLIGINLFYTFSYGAWLALLISLIVIIGFMYNKLRQKKYLFLPTMIILALIAWASILKLSILSDLGERSSFASRTMIWRSAGLMIEKNPLFGIGPGNFQNQYLDYQKYFQPYLEWSVPQPHNIFLAFWLESGIVGLIGFAFLLYLFLRANKKAIQTNRDHGILFLAIMVYILVHGLVDTTYWRNDLAVVFWMIIASNLYLSKAVINSGK